MVYSEKYKIKGKQERFDRIGFQVNAGKFAKFLGAAQLPANLKGKHEQKRYIPPRIERKGRGPLLFAYSKVIYTESEDRLHLTDFVGKNVLSRGSNTVKKGIYETVVDEKQQELDGMFVID